MTTNGIYSILKSFFIYNHEHIKMVMIIYHYNVLHTTPQTHAGRLLMRCLA